MNLDERRLKEITEYKAFYNMRLQEEPTELGRDLIHVKLKELDEEQNEILKRCNAL